MTMELARYEADGQEIAITDDDVRYVLAANQNVTNEEMKLFIELCVAHKLNPFIKEAYIVKYGNQPATLLIGKDVWLKRAMRNPLYRGHQAGLTFIGQDGKLRRREGSMLLDGEQLIGAWAKVYLKGFEVPLYDEVSFNEYAGRKKDGSLNRQWASMPSTMLRKVALVHVLREAFPDEFCGCYDASEMGVETDGDGNPITSQAVTIEGANGTTVERIPVYEEPQINPTWEQMMDGERMAFVEEVAKRDVPEVIGPMTDEQWEAF